AVHRPAAPADLARVRFEHAEDDAHGGGLAGAVGADEPAHLSLRDGEGDGVEGDEVAVAAGEIPEFEHGGVGWSGRGQARIRASLRPGGRCIAGRETVRGLIRRRRLDRPAAYSSVARSLPPSTRRERSQYGSRSYTAKRCSVSRSSPVTASITPHRK